MIVKQASGWQKMILVMKAKIKPWSEELGRMKTMISFLCYSSLTILILLKVRAIYH